MKTKATRLIKSHEFQMIVGAVVIVSFCFLIAVACIEIFGAALRGIDNSIQHLISVK